MFKNNITDETCSIYQAWGWTNGMGCTEEIKCKNCHPGGACDYPTGYLIYGVEQYAPINGEDKMMNEIFQRGPISCGVSVTDDFEKYKGGIITDATKGSIDHEISLVGYGTDNGVPFWYGRNSWGTFWGERGFFRIYRGNNTL